MLSDSELTKKATIARDVLPVECSLARFRVAQDCDLSQASQGSGVNGTSFTVSARYENDIKGHVTGEVRPARSVTSLCIYNEFMSRLFLRHSRRDPEESFR